MDKLIDAAEMIAHQLAARCRRCDVRLVPLREWNYETGRSSWRSYCDQPNSKSARELDHQRDEKAIKELFDAAVPVILREPSRVRQRRVKRSR